MARLALVFALGFLVSSSASLSSAIAKENPSLAFEDGYTQLFGDGNLMLLHGGKTVHIALDEKTGKTIEPLSHSLSFLLISSLLKLYQAPGSPLRSSIFTGFSAPLLSFLPTMLRASSSPSTSVPFSFSFCRYVLSLF